MSIASRIQEIETHIGDVYDTINYSYDTTGVNKNIINIPKYLKKGYIDIINNGIDTLYNNFPKVSGIGSNLSLTPTYEAPIKLNEIQGDTLQDGTPTPSSPVPIQSVTGLQNVDITGKNLLDASQGRLGTFGTLTISYSNGEILLNGTATALVDFYVATKVSTPTYNEDLINYMNNNIGAYTLSNNLGFENYFRIGGSYPQNTGTITSTNKVDLIFVRIPAGNYDNKVLNIQLEKGSQATEYEPYKGNTYEVNLGKNLFDVSVTPVTTWRASIISGSNLSLKPTQSDGSGYVAYDIPVSSNTTYTVSVEEIITENYDTFNGQFYLYEYNSSNTQSFIANISKSNLSRTFTTKTDTVKLRLQPYAYSGTITDYENITVTYKNIQLEKGQATSYSPYFTPIELNKIGDYQDSIKKSTGKNLFDKDNVNILNAYFNVNGVISNNDTRSFYVPCKPNTTYTIQKNGSARFRIGTTETIPENGVSVANYVANDNDTPIIITTSSTAKYIICYFYATFDTNTKTLEQVLDTIQIEENSQATDYEPYGKVWYEEKNIQKVIINENSPTYQSGNLTNVMRMACNSGYTLISDTRALYCDKLQVDVGYTHDYEQIYLTNNNFYIFINKSRGVTDNTTFKTWLASNNLICYVVLATPTYTEITNTELINQLEELYTAKSQEGTTNISITSEDLEMILNVSALKGEE